MGIAELFEIGFFTAFWNWSNPILTVFVYLGTVIGAALQTMIQKKCCKPSMRWMVTGCCGIGIMFSECLWQAITGWDRLIVDFFYGFTVCVLLGALAAFAVFAIKNKG